MIKSYCISKMYLYRLSIFSLFSLAQFGPHQFGPHQQYCLNQIRLSGALELTIDPKYSVGQWFAWGITFWTH